MAEHADRLCIKKRSDWVDLKGFVCIFAPCGGRGKNRGSDRCLHRSQQPSAGRLPLGIRISSAERHTKKETHPFGWISFLVDLRRFELPTPTMRMWCAPGPCVSRALFAPGFAHIEGLFLPSISVFFGVAQQIQGGKRRNAQKLSAIGSVVRANNY